MTEAIEQQSDEALMISYQNGNEKAFEVLYGRYRGRVNGYLLKRLYQPNDAEDLLQRIFIKLHRSRHSYRNHHPFAKWLYIICRSELIDHLRQAKRSPIMSQQVEIEAAVVDDSVSVRSKRFDELVDQDSLSDQERKALLLRYQDDQEFRDISAALGISEAGARKVISRAVQKLRLIYRRWS